ncbi:MAG: alanine--tRNA ligase [Candidatus Thermoplasmatota archaeon]|nr:alanine--tRNA ligase [Candidatus Thermoplasmatota archaeon]
MDEPNKELDLTFFRDHGFERRKCTNCGSFYWTLSSERTTCGDPACDSYSFIGLKTTAKAYDMNSMRKLFIDFFKPTHGVVQPYPVVPRWRNDVLLVNASIYDFQPHVTSGRVNPPFNPLVMSQPSIRMVDIDIVGNTGRHLTCFEMLCHDAFNTPQHEIYWKDGTVKYCFDFLTGPLEIQKDLITFKEKPWSGGGNGGNALEVFIRGVEVATLVFMDMREDPDGKFRIDDENYSKMDLRIVDTGYGLERLVWLSQGTSTIYQAVFPEVLETITGNISISLDNNLLKRVSEISSLLEPFNEKELLRLLHVQISKSDEEYKENEEKFRLYRDVFSLADHTKTITILLSNYVIPSNVKVGYLLRMLIRRSEYLIEKLGLKLDVLELMKIHSRILSGVLKEINFDFARTILGLEKEKYKTMLSKGRSIVTRLLEKKGKITPEDLAILYDSEGLNPEYVAKVAKESNGIEIEIPDNFRSLVVSRHDGIKKEKSERSVEAPDIFTRPLYYDDTSIREFNAVVLYSKDNKIITNQTAFYPEGGGQPSDRGIFRYHGKEIEMKDAVRAGRSIVHHLSSNIPENSRIIGIVDSQRRDRHTVHHSATHLLLGTLIKELGQHVWQTGVQKGFSESRLDFTHFEKLSKDQIRRIEQSVYRSIRTGHRITVKNIEWNKALSTYGFRLFQGGVPEDNKIRVVEIEGIDAEGCGGTHLKNTSEIGFFKIIKAESIQEGIQRITFCAGDAAMDYVNSLQDLYEDVSDKLGSRGDAIKGSLAKLVDENLNLRKEKDQILKEQVNEIINAGIKVNLKGLTLTLMEFRGNEVEEYLSKALFSRKISNSVLLNAGKGEIKVYSAVGKASELAEEITRIAPSFTKTKISGRFTSLRSDKPEDVKLIKENFVG